MVCNIENEACMLDACSNCPSLEAVRNLISFDLDENELLEEEVSYVQWVNTDRCDLVTLTESSSDFVENLLGKLIS